MEKKEYETPKVEFFRVEELVLCDSVDSGFGWEEEEEEPW